MKKTNLLLPAWLAILALWAFALPAAVNEYSFNSTSSAYAEISGGTVLGSAANDDESFNALPLGFTFVYNEVPYTEISIQTDAFLAFGPAVLNSTVPLSAGTGTNNVVAALSRDLVSRADGELMYLLSGSEPNRVFTVQWINYRRTPTTAANDNLNFQIQLRENGNQIVFVYGSVAAVDISTAQTVQVGLRGDSNADFNNRSTTTDWLNTLTGTANNASCRINSTVYPPSGLAFTFSPPTAGLPPSPAGLVGPPNGALNVSPLALLQWASGGGLPTGYRLSLGTDYPPTNLLNYTDLGPVNSYDPVPDLAYNTTYHWQVIPYNGAGDAVGCPIWSFTTHGDQTITALPYTQNFDGVTAPALPWDWTSLIQPANANASVGTSASSPHSPPNCARLYNGTLTSSAVLLIAPPLPTAIPANTTRLRLWAKGSGNFSVGVMSNPLDAATYQQTHTAALTANWTEYTFHLNGYGGSGSYIALRHGQTGSSQNIYVDDAQIEEIPQHDLAATGLTGPAVTSAGYPTSCNVSLYNWGFATEGDYSVKLYDALENELASSSGIPIAPAATVQVPVIWTPATSGNYTLHAKVVLAGDGDASNDQFGALQVEVHAEHDLAATSLAGGAVTSVGYPSSYTIGVYNWGANAEDVYAVKIYDALDNELATAPGVSVGHHASVQVPVIWTPATSGNYTLHAKVVLAGDGDASNDQFGALAVAVHPEHDLAATGLAGPAYASVGSSGTYNVSIYNWGANSEGIYTVKLFDALDNELATGTGLPVGHFATVQVPMLWTPTVEGNVVLHARVYLAGDGDAANDASTPLNVFVFPAGMMEVTVGDGSLTTRLPFDFHYRNSLYETLYYPSELGMFGNIFGITLYNSFSTNLPLEPVSIWMGSTTLNDLNGGYIPSTQLTQVFSGTVTFPSGTNTINIPLQTPYAYVGGNLVVLFHRPMDTTYYSSVDAFRCQSGTASRARYAASYGILFDPASPPEGMAMTGFPKTTFQIAALSVDPVFSVTPASHNFGTIPINVAANQSFVVRNLGGGTLTINGIGISGDACFSLQDMPALPASLATGENLAFTARYLPTAVGSHSAAISITDNITRQTHTVSLSGNVIDTTIYNLPYLQNFNAVISPALPMGWIPVIQPAGTVGVIATVAGHYKSAPNSVHLINNGGVSGASVILVAPPLAPTIPLNTTRLHFWGNADSQYILQIGAMTDPYDTSTFTLIQTVAMTNPTLTWVEYNVLLYGYTGTGRHIAFKIDPVQSVFLDDIQILGSYANDLAALSLTGNTTPTLGVAASYVATIKNEGFVSQNSYTVKLLDAAYTEVASAAGTPLAPGATAQISLTWTPTAEGPMALRTRVELSGDQNPSNDISPALAITVMPSGTSAVTIGEGNVESPHPWDFSAVSSLDETLYLSTEIMFFGNIYALSFYNSFQNNLSNEPIKIWMASTNLSSLEGGWIPSTQLSLVFDGTVTFPAGSNTITIPLQTLFPYAGGNLAVMFYRPLDTTYYYYNYFWGQIWGSAKTLHVASSSGSIDPANPPVGYLSGYFGKTTFLMAPFGANPVFSAFPASWDFGDVQTGTNSAPRTFTITNVGGGTLGINTPITLTGANTADFVLTDTNAYPVSLGLGQTMSVSVMFHPTSFGIKQAHLQITDNLARAQHTIPLSGTGEDQYINQLPYLLTLRETPQALFWQQTNTGSGITDRWSVSTTNYAGGLVPEWKCHWLQVNPATTRLISRPVATTGLTMLIVKYRQMINDYGVGCTYKFGYGYDASNFTYLWTQASVGNATYPAEEKTFTLTSHLAGHSVVYFCWEISGDLFQFDDWYIDNIKFLEDNTQINQGMANGGAVSIPLPAITNTSTNSPLVTNVLIEGLANPVALVNADVGYANPDIDLPDTGLYFGLTGTNFNGSHVTITHNLGFVPLQIAYRVNGSDWTMVDQPGSAPLWTASVSFIDIAYPAKSGDRVEIVFPLNGDQPLPVELSSFTAALTSDGKVRISWVSQSETGMLGYRVYRNTSSDQATALNITPVLIPAANGPAEQAYGFDDAEVSPGLNYNYWLECVDYNQSSFHGPVSVLVQGDVPPVLPVVSSLGKAYPNPFKAGACANIDVAVKEGESGVLSIYNIAGQCVRSFQLPQGFHKLAWDGRDHNGSACASGIYFYRLSTPSMVQTRKMAIIK